MPSNLGLYVAASDGGTVAGGLGRWGKEWAATASDEAMSNPTPNTVHS
jgi:hypothetical protein